MLPYQHTIVADGMGGSLNCLPFVTQAGPDVLASQSTVQDNLEPMHTIRAYPLHDQAVPLQPAAQHTGMTVDEAVSARLNLASARRRGWQLRCPHAFTAIWNGGPNPEDIEIHLDAGATGEDGSEAPIFVQSQLGKGLLTFHAGYQFKTEEGYLLWVRGPINAPKDGIAPLESLVEAAVLPYTVTVHWQFTRPHQTVRFAAGEPFATILPYAKSARPTTTLDVAPLVTEDDVDAYEQAVQQMVDSAAVQSVFQRMGARPAETAPPAAAPDSEYNPASQWAAQLSDQALRKPSKGNQSSQATLKPILVTGSHRSGTTWVGRMLSLSSSVAYVHEPFNINNTHPAGGMGFRNWFTYIPDEDIDLCVRRMERIIKLEDPLGSALRNEKRVALLKDPIALFSAEWLASQFDMNVVVLVRNPLAFAGSLKAQSWTHPFEHFLNQPKLMRTHLDPFAAEIRRYVENPPDIIDQACLLWNLIYSVVRRYREEHPEWIFLRHEDASWQPVSTFKMLYDRLGLRFTEEIFTQVEAYTDLGKEEGIQHHSGVMRDSRSNIMSWQQRLTTSEIERVRTRTASVAGYFYDR